MALIRSHSILRPAVLATGLSAACIAAAQEPAAADTLLLHDVEVRAVGPTAPRQRADGSVAFSASMLDHTVRTLGEADMLRLVGLASGTAQQSDYTSGPTVDGSSWSHNGVSAAGVPVIFPYHFGGIFSTFNTAVYPRATLHKSIHPISHPDRLGALTELGHGFTPDRLTAEANVGMTASSAALRTPVGKSGISVGAAFRASYISMLYGNLLGGRSTDIDYGFEDLDLNARWEGRDGHTVDATFHYNGDRLDYTDKNYGMITRLHWRNIAGGLTWRKGSMTQRAYVTSMGNKLTLDITDIAVRVPASTLTAGLDGEWSHNPRPWGWGAGYSAMLHTFLPQIAEATGLGEAITPERRHNSAGEGRAWGEVRWRPISSLRIDLGAAATIYGNGSYTTVMPSPRLTASINAGSWNATAHTGRYVQCVHYLGLSEIGLASNFRFGSTADSKPQSAWNFAVAAGRDFAVAGINVSLDAYYKIVERETEYAGTVLQLLNSHYNAADCIESSNGYNAGASVTARLNRSNVSGWVSYSIGTARRRTADGGWRRAATDMGHALTADASWRINDHWMVNSLFQLASGRPYTPVRAIYIIGERIITEYGERNSARFPLYHRLDLGGSYSFRSGKLTHTISLSVLNAYGHDNVELQSWNVNMKTGRYYLRTVSSLYRWLPSVSYTIKFSN